MLKPFNQDCCNLKSILSFPSCDTSINNINNTLPSYLQNITFDNYTGSLNSTLTSIINTNSSQDTTINNILSTLPSYLKSATAASTYQPVGSYLTTSSANLIYQELPWVAGQVSMHPTTGATILIQAGKNNFTASRSSTGITAIGFPNIGGVAYTPFIQIRSIAGFTTFVGTTTVQFSIYTYNSSSVLVDTNFAFFVYRTF